MQVLELKGSALFTRHVLCIVVATPVQDLEVKPGDASVSTHICNILCFTIHMYYSHVYTTTDSMPYSDACSVHFCTKMPCIQLLFNLKDMLIFFEGYTVGHDQVNASCSCCSQRDRHCQLTTKRASTALNSAVSSSSPPTVVLLTSISPLQAATA